MQRDRQVCISRQGPGCSFDIAATSVGVVQAPASRARCHGRADPDDQRYRDGPVCTLILSGDLDISETGGFLDQAALTIDDRIERLVLDLAGVAFMDCAGVRALTTAIRFAPGRCPVVVPSLSPMARRILKLQAWT